MVAGSYKLNRDFPAQVLWFRAAWNRPWSEEGLHNWKSLLGYVKEG